MLCKIIWCEAMGWLGLIPINAVRKCCIWQSVWYKTVDRGRKWNNPKNWIRCLSKVVYFLDFSFRLLYSLGSHQCYSILWTDLLSELQLFHFQYSHFNCIFIRYSDHLLHHTVMINGIHTEITFQSALSFWLYSRNTGRTK
jgi:hypothetical protein